MKMRFLVTLAMVSGIGALAYQPALLALDNDEAILATEVPYLANPERQDRSSLGPYGVLSSRTFLQDPYAGGGDALPTARTYSYALAASEPISGAGITLLPPEDSDPLRGVGSVLTDEDLAVMLAAPERVRDLTLSYPVDTYGGSLSAFVVGGDEESPSWVDGRSPSYARAPYSKLGDMAFLLGAWSLSHPDLSLALDPTATFATDLAVEETQAQPREDLEAEIFRSYEAFKETMDEELTRAVRELRAEGVTVADHMFDADGLYTVTDGGPLSTARGAAYSLLARAARPGSLALPLRSSGVDAYAFLQPDGDVAVLTKSDFAQPLTLEVPFEAGVTRYTLSPTPGEWNLILVPGRLTPRP